MIQMKKVANFKRFAIFYV